MAVGKHELATKLAAAEGLTKKAATEQIEQVLAVVRGTLAEGESVRLQHFGTFNVVDRAERAGRNPLTGEDLIIAAHKAISFKTAKDLKAAIQAK